MKVLTKCLLLTTVLIAIFSSCSKDKENNGPKDYYRLDDLPADTGGVQKGYQLGVNESPYGYYVYTPSHHDKIDDVVYPLLVFLHGAGEKGTSENDASKLDLVLRNGPPKMIKKNTWAPAHPMIVASPQCHDGGWSAAKLKAFVEHIMVNYKVNIKRIYITGLSMGGGGTFSYIGVNGDSSYVAAAVPICGSGQAKKAKNFKNIAIWAFHGDNDVTVPYKGSTDMIKAINEAGTDREAKVTIYPGVGHNSWTMTYDGTGIGKESLEYDAFRQNIYDWMFLYERNDLDSLKGHFYEGLK